jgi:AcrR family transcriptional regulator
MAAMVPSNVKMVQVLRRAPQQDRARRRVAHVLDTADHLLATEGPDALTTTRVAEAAGISVGSLYQWFPDREAIAEALALRYAEDFSHVVDELDADVGAIVDAFADAFRAAPGFRAMWFGGLRTQRLRDVTRPALDRIAETLAARWDAPVPVATVGVTAADALLRHAFRVDADGDPETLAEAKLLLTAYLDRRL